MKTKYSMPLSQLAIAGALVFCALQAQAEELAGQLDWAELHYASVPVEGFVDDVLVRVGQRVAKGDKLLQLNTTLLAANVNQTRARVAGLRPARDDARREYKDAKTLYEQTVLSDVELQRAKMGFDMASAKLEEAEAKLTADSALLARAAQYAPWDAWVIERQLESGQVIVGDVRSQPVVVLARADTMVVEATASFETRSRLVVGQAVEVRYRDKTYSGKIQSLALAARGKSDAAYSLRAAFAVDPGRVPRVGDSASLVLP